MPEDAGRVTVINVGEGVVVISADAERAEAAADELRNRGSHVAVFVGEPGPAAEEFGAEVFGTPR